MYANQSGPGHRQEYRAADSCTCIPAVHAQKCGTECLQGSARLLTRDIKRDGGVYLLWFLGCRTIGISYTFRPMLWDAWNASDFQTHCIGNDSD
jgi:hypothetical protein